MSFDKATNRADFSTDALALVSQRRARLSELDKYVAVHPGLACGIIERLGLVTLNVINIRDPTRKTNIVCDFIDGEWQYVWAEDGRSLGPADDPMSVVGPIAAELGARLQPVRNRAQHL
ncbi:hypothetical protein J4573_38130 [Actinomadura barringtoniae]|uniref:Uncharacterized protein n=1 Tax=Actinomadura barringtoniae TaxID=1427535 RepID=A0A939TAX9_9ACTN|nr:hypothetical protein [Actinomadura barringtoniae]MBO2452962.1 hypothetical protein [Actinomadura barringtoniae]